MSGVDIVVPCWNAQGTLGAAIESALRQQHLASITIVDDGSTDGSLAVARGFEPRVRVVTGPNHGVAAARNTGAALGSAGWIVFLDADDLLLPDTIARRLAVAATSGASVIICDWQEFNAAGAVPSRPRPVDWELCARDPELGAATRVWAPPAAILYCRAAFAGTGGFRGDVSPIEDARLLFDSALQGARFAHAGHVGAAYRITPDSLSRANPARFWGSVLRNGQQIEALWRARNTLDAARRAGLSDIYNTAARGLFAAAHPDYFKAVAAQRRLGPPQPAHSRVAMPLARLIGLHAARRVLALAGRS